MGRRNEAMAAKNIMKHRATRMAANAAALFIATTGMTVAEPSTPVKASTLSGTSSITGRDVLGDACFAAYHTRTNPSPVGHIGKYEDLVVSLGKANRLEFSRANGYQPQWRTASGVHRVESPIPITTEDPDCNYSYVRLLENGPDKIVVHWRHFRDIDTLTKANIALDPINPHGITGAVHELFTIFPDGRMEREIRDAANTRYQDQTDRHRHRTRCGRARHEASPLSAGRRSGKSNQGKPGTSRAASSLELQ